MEVRATISKSIRPYMLKLIPHLKTLKRKDTLTDEKIKEIAGVDFKKLDTAIRNWFLCNGMVIRRRYGEKAYYLLSAAEQSPHSTVHRTKKALGQLKRGAYESACVPVEDLTQLERDTHDRRSFFLAALIRTASETETKIRLGMGHDPRKLKP